ncbi:MAG: glycosyltransferase family 1 protein, partial [Kiritimatiellia bacterium]|nr:glycosyltransferase family 1 protein [Kiritimatiellia bacterium]
RVRTRHRLGERYLLFVGLLSTRKNVVALIEAFEMLAPTRPELHLVLAGARSHGVEAVDDRLARSPVRERIVTPGFVPSEDLPALYSGAAAFVFPTRDEGFGLPVLEALACGTAVVASDLPVLREVGGPHPRWCEPGSPEALARALRDCLAAEPDPVEVERRRDWAARFRWNETARQT